MAENVYTSKVVRNKEQNFDFILYLNDKPIVQRWFEINDFNKESLKSMELRQMLGDLIGMDGREGIITKKLKADSIEYLWSNYNPYYIQEEAESLSSYENTHTFRLDILYKGKTFISGEFSGNVFPIGKYSKDGGRCHVDIYDNIFEIISVIRDYLSRDEYVTI